MPFPYAKPQMRRPPRNMNFQGPNRGRHANPAPQQQRFHGKRNSRPNDVLAALLRGVLDANQGMVFDESVGLLRLDGFKSFPVLKTAVTSINFDAPSFCDTLCSVIGDLVRPQFISIERNEITSPQVLLNALVAHDLHVGLKGLSFSNNNVTRLDFLNALREFQSLVEIQFVGNPVTEVPEYRRRISKRVPWLIGLDGSEVKRPPLALPWPIPSGPYEAVPHELLQSINTLLGNFSTGPADACSQVYHPEATFTLTIIDFRVNSNERQNSVRKDIALLRQFVLDRNRNPLRGGKLTSIFKGQHGVMEALQHIYPKYMITEHDLSPNADVQILQDGTTKIALAVVTVHGSMTWRHRDSKSQAGVAQSHFDRTFSFVNAPSGGWLIVNDLLHLRPPIRDVLFLPKGASRMQMLERRYPQAQSILCDLVDASSNDVELDLVAQLTEEQLKECIASAGGSVSDGILLARIVSQYRITPTAGCTLVGKDPAAMEAAVAAMGPENFWSRA